MYEELEYEFAEFKTEFEDGGLVFGKYMDESVYEDDYSHNEIHNYMEKFVEKVKELKEVNRYAPINFEAIVFPQIWGSTCTGFDVCKDGSPAIGGRAMTKEYTTIIHELLTDTYVVCFGDRPCYRVTDANEEFLADLNNRNMASLSEAKKRY